jgi:hypothetical protein
MQLGACFRLGTDKEGKDVLEPLDAPAPGEEESRLEQLVDPVEPVLCQ